MKKFLRLILLTTLPLAAVAQTAAPVAIQSAEAPATQSSAQPAATPVNPQNTPVIIVDQGQQLGVQPAPEIARPVPGRGFANFPENAVSRIGENTTGQHLDAPAAPGTNLSPASAPTPANAPTPASPTPPSSPAAKLWPRDARKIFMVSCVGFHEEFIVPCNCVINRLIATMPHDEFLRESEAGTIENDERITKIRTDCATTPQPKKE